MGRPLEGVTVLDHSTVGPASRCSSALADLGADVVKVVRPAGGAEPPWHAYGAGRGTRRVVLDLKAPADRATRATSTRRSGASERRSA